jgi:hypothetical protein
MLYDSLSLLSSHILFNHSISFLSESFFLIYTLKHNVGAVSYLSLSGVFMVGILDFARQVRGSFAAVMTERSL